MPSRRAKLSLLACGVLVAALPALAASQDVALPPGFGDPVPVPPPTPTEQPRQEPVPQPLPLPGEESPPGFGDPRPSQPAPRAERPRPQPMPVEETTDSALEDLAALPPPEPARFYDLPDGLRRPVDVVGVIGNDNRGLPIDAFGDATGPWLRTLMQRLDAPIPSRWTSILLRRALMSRLAAPRATDPVDWVAERVRLLLRMGEADAARMLAQSVDIDNFTPAMVGAAYEAALASSDPAGLCPLVEKGRELSEDSAWSMAAGMCAAMEGEQVRSGTLLDEARRRRAENIDLLLAEKVVGSGADTRRSVRINWDPVTEINLWRFGLASATGNVPPDRLLNAAPPRMQAWLARAPMVPVAQRLAAAETAAALGVFSAHSLVDIYALAADLHQEEEPEPTTALLQRAYTGNDLGARLGALRELWEDGDDGLRRHGRLLLTAGPAALIAPNEQSAGEADQIVAALLGAGMDREAARWAEVAEGGSRAWALLAVGAPRPVVDNGQIGAFAEADTSAGGHRTALLAAALAGLGRIEAGAAQGYGVAVGNQNDWTRALDRAASAGQGGTVALLAAIGMQSADWTGVPPDHLFHILRALRQVGLEFEARMIAAEALTRA